VAARIEAAVQKKVEGQEVTLAEAPEGGGGAQVIDLMEALRASLEKKPAARAKAAEPAAAPAVASAPAAGRKPAKRAAAAEPAAPAVRKAAKK
jgi:DNA end-binding protein Ku